MKLTNRQIQKEKTSTILLQTAASLFKKNGLRDTSIDEVMAGAGLTRGSFYSYFKNKTDLAIRALRWSINKSHLAVEETLKEHSNNSAPDELQVFLNHYLSHEHRDNIESGCPVAALSRDFGKETLAARKEFALILNETIEQRRSLLRCRGTELSRDEWMGVMCTYVGSLIIARACRGSDLSNEVLSNANMFLEKLTSESS